jgi:hypothetical protein
MENDGLNGGQRYAVNPCRGVAKLVKALDFDSSMQRFESFLPCQICSPVLIRSQRAQRTGINLI